MRAWEDSLYDIEDVWRNLDGKEVIEQKRTLVISRLNESHELSMMSNISDAAGRMLT